MGGAQPLAVTMNGGVCLGVEVDPTRIERRLETRYLDEVDRRPRRRARPRRCARRDRGEPLSVGAARQRRRGPAGAGARAASRPTSSPTRPRPTTRSTATSPPGLTLEDAAERCARATPTTYIAARAGLDGARTCARCSTSSSAGAIVFDYGNNLRQQALEAGVENAFDFPGFVPAYIRPLFCEGKGPFRWVALSGDPADIARTDQAVARALPRRRSTCTAG